MKYLIVGAAGSKKDLIAAEMTKQGLRNAQNGPEEITKKDMSAFDFITVNPTRANHIASQKNEEAMVLIYLPENEETRKNRFIQSGKTENQFTEENEKDANQFEALADWTKCFNKISKENGYPQFEALTRNITSVLTVNENIEDSDVTQLVKEIVGLKNITDRLTAIVPFLVEKEFVNTEDGKIKCYLQTHDGKEAYDLFSDEEFAAFLSKEDDVLGRLVKDILSIADSPKI